MKPALLLIALVPAAERRFGGLQWVRPGGAAASVPYG